MRAFSKVVLGKHFPFPLSPLFTPIPLSPRTLHRKAISLIQWEDRRQRQIKQRSAFARLHAVSPRKANTMVMQGKPGNTASPALCIAAIQHPIAGLVTAPNKVVKALV